MRSMKSHITVMSGEGGFHACVTVGGGAKGSKTGACSRGKNPRDAVANAMEKVAHSLRKRRGVYRGMRR